MTEEKNSKSESQEQKPKRSKLAVASLLIPVILTTVWFCILYCIDSPDQEGFRYIFQEYSVIIVWVSWLVSLILGIVALRRVKKSKGVLKGFSYALAGVIICSCMIVASLIYLAYIYYAIHEMINEAMTNTFPFNLFPTQ